MLIVNNLTELNFNYEKKTVYTIKVLIVLNLAFH